VLATPISSVGFVQYDKSCGFIIVSRAGVHHWAPILRRHASCWWHYQILCWDQSPLVRVG
jgi:hypothetical protein